MLPQHNRGIAAAFLLLLCPQRDDYRLARADTLSKKSQTRDRVRRLHCRADSEGPPEAARWLKQLESGQTIGSEYGEVSCDSGMATETFSASPEVLVRPTSYIGAMKGYIQYRFLRGSRIDSTLIHSTSKLQMKGAARMRTSMKPDEAFGMIFDLEGSTAGSP